MLFFVEPPEKNQQNLNMAIGLLLAGLGQVIAYFFSSNESSTQKNDTINTLVQNTKKEP